MQTDRNNRTDLKGYLRWLNEHRITALIPIVVCLAAAFLIINISPKRYRQSSSLVLNFSHFGWGMTRDVVAFNDLSIIKQQSSIDNEMEIFGSYIMAEKLVQMLDMQNEIYSADGFTDELLYQSAPFEYKFAPKEGCTAFSADAVVTGKGLKLNNITANRKTVTKELTIAYGESVALPCGTLTITETGGADTCGRYRLAYRDARSAALELTQSIRYHTASVFATAHNFTYTDKSAERAKAVLLSLPKAFNDLWHEYNQTVVDETSVYIDRQLASVQQQLADLETDVAAISAESGLMIPQIDNPITARRESATRAMALEAETELYITGGILDHILAADSMAVIPLNSGAENKALNALITEYNACVIQWRKLSENGTESPLTLSLADDARQLKKSIFTTLENRIDNLLTTAAEIGCESDKADQRIDKASKTELSLTAKTRRIGQLQKVYAALRKKQMECFIANDADINAVRIIRNPMQEAKLVCPNVPSIMFLAILFGLILIPYACYLVSETFGNRPNRTPAQ